MCCRCMKIQYIEVNTTLVDILAWYTAKRITERDEAHSASEDSTGHSGGATS